MTRLVLGEDGRNEHMLLFNIDAGRANVPLVSRETAEQLRLRLLAPALGEDH